MSESPPILVLLPGQELPAELPISGQDVAVQLLNEATAAQALEAIFRADHLLVWGKI